MPKDPRKDCPHTSFISNKGSLRQIIARYSDQTYQGYHLNSIKDPPACPGKNLIVSQEKTVFNSEKQSG